MPLSSVWELRCVGAIPQSVFDQMPVLLDAVELRK